MKSISKIVLMEKKKIIDLEFLKKEVFFRIQVFSVCLCGARETRDECLILWQQSAMLWGCVTLESEDCHLQHQC